MKRIVLCCLTALLFACMSGIACAQDAVSPATPVASAPANFVKVYYFYTNYRCANCYNMEKWTKEIVADCFKADVDAGRLKLELINTETPGNEHYAKEYQLYTKAVILSLVKDGKEVKSENMTKIWETMKKRESFCQYIQEGIARYLKGL